MGDFQGFGVFDQDVVVCGYVGVGYDCGWGGQVEGVGVGDYQYCYGVNQGLFQVDFGDQLGVEGDQCDEDYYWDEDLVDFVYQFLDWCFGGLGVFYQVDDFCQYCFFVECSGVQEQVVFVVDCVVGDFVVGSFGYWQVFVGDQCFVGVVVVVEYFVVYWEVFVGMYYYFVVEV